MNKLKVGFGRVNITPAMGTPVAGYYKERFAEGVLDELEANAIAFECDGFRSLLISVDHCGLKKVLCDIYREKISAAVDIPTDRIIITTTHTHTGPVAKLDSGNELVDVYVDFLGRRLVDVSILAIADIKDAKMGFGKGIAPHIAFVRRFRMKDGSVETNPGVNNPNIDHPLGEVDETVHVLRFDREGADTVILANFANHPDTVGGNKISGDWPTLFRHQIEKSLDGVKSIFINGAQGDVNHVNVFPEGGDLNGMFMDFDDVSRGYTHAIHMGRVVAGAVLQCYDKVKYVDVDSIDCREKTISLASNKPTPEQMPEARRINDLYVAGRDHELPYKGMMLTTVVAEAARMVRLENAPDFFPMPLMCMRIGNISLIGIAGEPFTGIGVGLKATEGFDFVCPICNANGDEGYFPMQSAYDEGGYESRSSEFKAGVAENIIAEGRKFMLEMKK